MFLYIIVGLAMGFVFGFALEKGRVFEPGMIVGQFQMKKFTMLKMFMTAMATTMAIYLILTSVGLAAFSPKAAVYPAVILGGLIFGCGMALSGACPGTVLAQIGAGY
ncbi:YeeE/YedE family protein, partial [bacterium]|nr:YeeE/YedE family protein [bacterium]